MLVVERLSKAESGEFAGFAVTSNEGNYVYDVRERDGNGYDLLRSWIVTQNESDLAHMQESQVKLACDAAAYKKWKDYCAVRGEPWTVFSGRYEGNQLLLF